MLKTGVSLIRQSTGLKAASPWNRSNDSTKKLLREELVGVAEEFGLVRMAACFRTASSASAPAGLRTALMLVGRDVEERVLADDRVVALEHVLVIRIALAAQVVRIVVQRRMVLAVAVPLGEADPPAVLDGHEVAAGLPFAGTRPTGR